MRSLIGPHPLPQEKLKTWRQKVLCFPTPLPAIATANRKPKLLDRSNQADSWALKEPLEAVITRRALCSMFGSRCDTTQPRATDEASILRRVRVHVRSDVQEFHAAVSTGHPSMCWKVLIRPASVGSTALGPVMVAAVLARARPTW